MEIQLGTATLAQEPFAIAASPTSSGRSACTRGGRDMRLNINSLAGGLARRVSITEVVEMNGAMLISGISNASEGTLQARATLQAKAAAIRLVREAKLLLYALSTRCSGLSKRVVEGLIIGVVASLHFGILQAAHHGLSIRARCDRRRGKKNDWRAGEHSSFSQG